MKAEGRLDEAIAHAKTLRITQVRSAIGRPKDQKATIRALGFRPPVWAARR